jgi:hypothetical protein
MFWPLLALAASVAYADPPTFEDEDDYAIINFDKIVPRNHGPTLAEYHRENFDQFRNRNEQRQRCSSASPTLPG